MKTIGMMTVLALGIGLVPVRAAIMTYSVLADNGGAYYSSGSWGTFDLPQFDAELGRLQNVVVSIVGSAHGGHIWVDNEWSAAGKVQLTLGMDILVSTPTLSILEFDPSWATSWVTLGADEDGAPDFEGADSYHLDGTVISQVRNYSPEDIDAYIGTGHMTYSFWGEGFSFLFPLSPLDVPGRVAEDYEAPSFSFNVMIHYDYTPASPTGGGGAGGNVPEPGTLAIGLALAGCSLVKWGRNRLDRSRTSGVKAEG